MNASSKEHHDHPAKQRDDCADEESRTTTYTGQLDRGKTTLGGVIGSRACLGCEGRTRRNANERIIAHTGLRQKPIGRRCMGRKRKHRRDVANRMVTMRMKGHAMTAREVSGRKV
ncbi:hypothetical protein VNO77_14328 [Canavalia gladiata]|uniref:Uncharacterized protein n=1 Tax=Canavalia gladiata TaxID=3824 RepID=A0AAN9M3D9_CANGL